MHLRLKQRGELRAKLIHVQNWVVLAESVKWSSARLAGKFAVSSRTLHRHFVKLKGHSIKVWLAEQRQMRGKELLEMGFSVKETAHALGYNHPTNFARRYKRFYGSCPSITVQVPRVDTRLACLEEADGKKRII
jgi:AraC-like DNA-binding protein